MMTLKTILIRKLVCCLQDMLEVKLMHENLCRKLIVELDYSEHAAAQTATDLLRIDHLDIKHAVNCWISYDEATPVDDAPFSADILMRQYGMTYPAALVFLDWYREDPVVAFNAIRVRM
ncbi:MAG: hypothetical protein ACOX7M_04970 [Dysosmobacter sp.]|uniref:hypothetical protein n=1 Tax=Dysosmobacter sp. TaxID=2591382 RepID=UPI003D9445C1